MRELVKPGQRTVIVGDDGTRLTPTHRIVPLLLDEPNAGGVTDDHVFESDHVLNIAYNIQAGGTCLEDIEHRRNDEGYEHVHSY